MTCSLAGVSQLKTKFGDRVHESKTCIVNSDYVMSRQPLWRTGSQHSGQAASEVNI